MNVGKQRKLNRFFTNGKTVIVPMDHGVTLGPIAGIEQIQESVDNIEKGGGNAVVLHCGLAARVCTEKIHIIVHLSGSTMESENPDKKLRVCTVKQAIRLGADAVSLQCNIGVPGEHEMLTAMAEVVREAEEYNIPVVAMMYPKGPFKNNETFLKKIKHAARLGAELGADVIKTSYTGEIDGFKQVVASCPVPIVIAGGPKMKNAADALQITKDAIESGAAGVAMGRNIFQHANPEAMVSAISRIVHQGATIEEAKDSLLTNFQKLNLVEK